jgi:aryl-alcohol dehydrogenase-like predicted oxidoreductase
MTSLDRKPLWTDGPDVARLCLGTMMFADQTDAAEAARILDAYMDAGGNFVDTADAYSNGACETMLGGLLADRRDAVILATKLGNPIAGKPGSGGLRPDWVRQAAADSLDRLRTDRVDLLYLHLEDDGVPLDETLGALAEVLAAGQARAWGFSNFRAWKIAEMVRVADAMGLDRPRVCQPYYHMLNRLAEIDTLPACAHFGLGVVPYSVLARGLLTGKYRGGTPDGSRAARNDTRMMETEFRPATIAAAGKAADHATARGNLPQGFALNWALANPIVTSVLVGPKSLAHMQDYLRAVADPYDAEDEAAANALNASGCAPAPLYADPRYPYRGRPVPAALR